MAEAGRSGGLGRASVLLASGTLVSRVLGFVNAAVLAAVIGLNGQASTAFAVANQLPNNIYAIIAGGLLSAVLVPQIVRAALHDDGGQRFINRLVTLGIVVFAGVTVLATLAAPLLVRVYASSGGQLQGDALDLAIAFASWCLPQIFFYAVYSLLGEVLNARGVFGPFTWAPVLNNLVMIGSVLAFALALGGDVPLRDPASWTADRVAWLAGGATLGVAAQALILVVFWRRTGLGFRLDFRWRGVGLGAAGRAAGWTFGMILVTQLAGIVQSQVATSADAVDASSRALMVAWLVFMLPHSIIAVSIATPYFTRMSHHARDGELDRVRADLADSLRTVGMLIFGTGVALVAASVPFAALFGRTGAEITSTALVLVAFLVGLVPFSTLFLLQRTFYALGDTRTPFFIQLVQAGVFVSGALLVLLLPSPLIAIGLAIVTTVAGTVQAIVALLVLRRRLGGLDSARWISGFGRFALATIPAGLAGLLVLWPLGGLGLTGGAGEPGVFATAHPVSSALSVGLVGAASLAVYLGVIALMRVPELRVMAGPILRRLPGRG
ncbi:murein biosynthesis integral membrane protein MurJ [Homoserinibacter sp. YIM 151385]|uniref:murein biosynthesis integral membrane protein MurJ n=1 Tax=Homoserinibacter sp. YIM 151385 TaxID=2985506 RepID=UPI002FDDD643